MGYSKHIGIMSAMVACNTVYSSFLNRSKDEENVYTPPLSLKDAIIRFLETEMRNKSFIASKFLIENNNKPFYTKIKNSKHQKSKKKRR